MTDFQRCQQAATAPACPEKGAALQLTPRHLELIRTAALALNRATDKTVTGAEYIAAMTDWSAAAERVAIALVSHLESFEVTPCP